MRRGRVGTPPTLKLDRRMTPGTPRVDDAYFNREWPSTQWPEVHPDPAQRDAQCGILIARVPAPTIQPPRLDVRP